MREAHRYKVLLAVQQGSSLGNRMGEFDSVLFPIIGLLFVQNDTQSMEALLLFINLRLELRDGVQQQSLLYFGIIGLRLDGDPRQTVLFLLDEMNQELHVNPVMQSNDHIRKPSESLFCMALRDRKADLFFWEKKTETMDFFSKSLKKYGTLPFTCISFTYGNIFALKKMHFSMKKTPTFFELFILKKI